MQYLQLQLGFSTPDQANVLVIASACSLTVKVWNLKRSPQL